MSEHKVYPVPAEFSAKTLLNAEQYAALYRQSVDDPEGFWAEQATDFLTWTKPWHKVLDVGFQQSRYPLVRRWKAQRHHQLSRSASRHARRSDRLDLGKRRSERR